MRLWIKYYFFASFLFRLVFLPFKFNIIKCLNKYCISVSIDVLLLFRLVDISIERGRKCENLNYSWMIISKKHKKKKRGDENLFFSNCVFSSFWYFYLWHFLIHIFSSWRNEERYWQYNAGELIGRFFWGYFDSFFGFWIAWEEFRHHLAKITETMLNSENLGF